MQGPWAVLGTLRPREHKGFRSLWLYPEGDRCEFVAYELRSQCKLASQKLVREDSGIRCASLSARRMEI